MTWARHASPPANDQGEFARGRAAEKIHYAIEHEKAVRTVAEYAADAKDCERLLEMLGLEASQGKRGTLA